VNNLDGGSPAVTPTFANFAYIRSAFGCSGLTDYDTPGTGYSFNPPSSLAFPDSTTLSLLWEPTPGFSGDSTGRIQKITLRQGGTVTYNYNPNSAGNDGLNCTYLVPNEITRTTTDGTTSYTIAWQTSGGSCSTSAACSTTTVVDPGGNQKVYHFSAGWGAASPATLALTEVQTYQNTGTVGSPTYSTTATTTDITCYNATAYNSTPSTCVTASVTLPVTSRWIYHGVGGSKFSMQETKIDKYGDVTYSAQYDFGATTPTFKTTISYGSWNGSNCTAWTGNVQNRACEVLKQDGSGHKLSDVLMTYSSAGNLLSTSVFNGSAYIGQSSNNTYNSNGTPTTAYDLANNPIGYTYSSSGYTGCGTGCSNYPFPTAITKGGLTANFTWYAIGGVIHTAEDPSGNTTTYGYNNNCGSTADPFWRAACVTDPLGNARGMSYVDSSNEVESTFSFNSNNSVNNILTILDGYGRTIDVQNETGPSATTWDTVSASYSWPSAYFQVFSSIPCSASTGLTCTTGVNTLYDVLQRPTTATETGSQAVTTYTYYTPASSATRVDTLMALSPAPSGEDIKQVQNEYDGLGRLTITCGILSSGGSSCNEANSASGIETAYTYTTAAGSYEVQAVRGSQSRTDYVDSLGRLTQSKIPETGSGTWSYYYDSSSAISCPSGYAGAAGQLKASVDPKGNLLCYAYDGLNRVTGINANNGTSCRHFYYDNSTGYSGTIPSGITINNPYGRMIEAATDSCSSGTLITDEWFSYDSLGRNTDMWELTPHSLVNGTHVYYHVNEAYFPNGAPNVETFAGIDANNTVVTYGIDGEGRWTSAEIGSANEITSVSYSAAQQPTAITFPTGEVNTTTSTAITAPGGGSLCHNQWDSACTFTVNSATNIVVNQMLNVDVDCLIPAQCNPVTHREEVQVESVSGTTVSIPWSGFRWNHASGVPVVSTTGDYDSYTYDPNTSSMTGFGLRSNESGGSLSGTLSWNPNGTLEQLAISDGFNSGGTQTCTFAYDDLVRLVSDLCGTGSTSYRSTMSYDQYNNITKSSSNGTAPVWPQSGSYSSTTNQLSSSTYDANGSTLTDYFHTYTWDSFNRMNALDSNTMTYDALGNVVEVASGSSYTVFEYTPIGSKIIWNESNVWTHGHLPLPGGTSLDWTPSATYIHHKDWLGSSRITTAAGVVYTDKAFGAYGEDTAQDFGGAGQFNFTGDWQDIETAVYDTPNREYMPFQSRWPNVDPARSGWNAYAYVTNPNSETDPLGLYCAVDVPLFGQLVGPGCYGGGGNLDGSSGSDPWTTGGNGFGQFFGGTGGGNGFCGDCAPPTLGSGGFSLSLSGQLCDDVILCGFPTPPLLPQLPGLTNCLPICDFTLNPNYQPPSWAQLQLWGLNLFPQIGWDYPGPPTLCYRDYMGQCLPIISGPSLPIVSAGPPAPTKSEIDGACQIYAINSNNSFDQLSSPTAWNANGVVFSQYTQYARPNEINPDATNVNFLTPLSAPAIFIQASMSTCMSAMMGGG
jgi:RHS repeat-associated protein